MATSLVDLRREIVKQGWHRKATGRVMGELLLNLAVAIIGIYIFSTSEDLLVRICAMIFSTAGSMGVATNTHSSSHYATSNRRWVNELLTYLGYPVFLGLSACYWWHSHVVVHHPSPNVIGVDDDADLAPWFARTEEEVCKSSGLRRTYYEKLQVFVFPLALALIGFNMQSGWRFLINSLRTQSNQIDKRYWIDLGMMVLHYIVWLAVPMIYFAPAHVIGFYVLRAAFMGYAMFAVPLPVIFLPKQFASPRTQEIAITCCFKQPQPSISKRVSSVNLFAQESNIKLNTICFPTSVTFTTRRWPSW